MNPPSPRIEHARNSERSHPNGKPQTPGARQPDASPWRVRDGTGSTGSSPSTSGSAERSGPATGSLLARHFYTRRDARRDRASCRATAESDTGDHPPGSGDSRQHESADRPIWCPLACILVAVLVANAPVLLHLVTTNPLVLNAALTAPAPGWLPGLPYIDGNAGFTMQALGHLAALDWLHGHIPWWNPYEGVGSPWPGRCRAGRSSPSPCCWSSTRGCC